MPWNVDGVSVKEDDAAKVEEARQNVVSSIDKGIPVQYGREEDGVIIGYRNGGKEWICINGMQKERFTEKKWPWGFLFFTSKKEKMPDGWELAVSSLMEAVRMARLPDSDNYFLGFNAWERYIERLKELDGLDDDARKNDIVGNAFIYECLAQYRSCASVYLKAVTGLFGGKAAEHMEKAAGLYDRLANRVLRDKENCVIAIAPYPWMMKEGQTWTPEMRKEQVRRLEEALPLESEAVSELEMTLAAL